MDVALSDEVFRERWVNVQKCIDAFGLRQWAAIDVPRPWTYCNRYAPNIGAIPFATVRLCPTFGGVLFLSCSYMVPRCFVN